MRTTIRSSPRSLLEITGSDAGIRYEPAGLTFVKNRIGDPDRRDARPRLQASVGLEDGLRELIDWRRSHIAEVDRRRAEAAGEERRAADLEQPVAAEAGAG